MFQQGRKTRGRIRGYLMSLIDLNHNAVLRLAEKFSMVLPMHRALPHAVAMPLYTNQPFRKRNDCGFRSNYRGW